MSVVLHYASPPDSPRNCHASALPPRSALKLAAAHLDGPAAACHDFLLLLSLSTSTLHLRTRTPALTLPISHSLLHRLGDGRGRGLPALTDGERPPPPTPALEPGGRERERDLDGCDIPTLGLIELIRYSYQQVAPSFLEADLQRTSRLNVLGPEQFGNR